MRNRVRVWWLLVAAISIVALAGVSLTQANVFGDDDKNKGLGQDFGLKVEKMLNSESNKLFGIKKPLAEPADDNGIVPRAEAEAKDRQLLAKGLKAEFVARNVAQLGDMISFWPNPIQYTHLMVCIEQGRSGTTPGGNGGLNAAVQRVNVQTGEVETILHGMSRCDGIRTTSWGTVLATEETDDGRGYEIIDPLNTTGHWIANRSTGDIRSEIDGANASQNVAQRTALPTMRWEGLAVLPSGALIGGDELRPGDDGLLDVDGGAIYKFVPDSPRDEGDGPISDLSESPFVAGDVYAMTVSAQPRTSSSFPQYGQGAEVGEAAWVLVNALTAPSDANARGATGYYRPEDLHDDPTFDGEGVRFCWTNTGNSGAKFFAEVFCAVDENPLGDGQKVDARTGLTYLGDSSEQRGYEVAVANRFIEGDERFNSHDNLDIQPHTGIVYVIEDDDFGEIFACLPDGKDRDIKSDGCIAILSVADLDAEPTGFIFDGTGKVAFYVVQHGEQPDSLLDFDSNPVNGRTDDLIKITGFDLKGPLSGGDDDDDD